MTQNLTYNGLCVHVAMAGVIVHKITSRSSNFLTERLLTLQYSSEIQSI